MTFWRILIGGLAVALALWILIGEQLAGASADATINARLVTVRSPIAGAVSAVERPLGSPVTTGEVIAGVDDIHVDGTRLDDLRMEAGFAEAEIARLTRTRDETEAIIDTLDERSATYRAARISDIEARLAFARERLDILESGELPDAFDVRPPRDAGVPGDDGAQAPGLRDLWVNAVKEQIAVLQIALDTAREGVFLGDGYNDAPNAEQRATELKSQLSAVSADLDEARSRLEIVSDRLDGEQLRVSRAAGAELKSPVNGIYWETLAADGEALQRGDPVARLLDCDSILVTLSVTESVYHTLAAGDGAVFRPRNSDRNFNATVVRLGGAGAETFYRNLAVAPSARHLERYDVAILVPELNADPELGCSVGRTGRVFFERRPLDWLRRLMG
ncbi:HlyD family efflux transporter periplasmic adaptor subunit [Oricola indica]|jgi:multidrug resistance efflux pump|uniref:HlyD family efflux transporter periplasmic adaptor subunit n=1 Tax=Oricola indica TaxID=2872591 RepID=UPI001CC1973D|nr:HlyD family secretion protein [Oricola indica]